MCRPPNACCRIAAMALAKLTETGEVQATRPWARPEAYETWQSVMEYFRAATLPHALARQIVAPGGG